MSATTSPRATIFPKFCSCRRRLSDTHFTEGPDLIVGIASLPQRRDDVTLEVRHVADDETRLPLGHHAHLSDGGGQDARLGALEFLGPSLVLHAHRVPHVREGEEAVRV